MNQILLNLANILLGEFCAVMKDAREFAQTLELIASKILEAHND